MTVGAWVLAEGIVGIIEASAFNYDPTSPLPNYFAMLMMVS
jgi:hypothetical protein